MWSEIRRNPLALFYALLVHAALFTLVATGLDWTSTPTPAPRAEVVEAVAVDQALVEKELNKIRDAEAERERKKREAIETREREEQRLAEVKKQQETEKRRLAQIEKERETRAAEAKRREQAEEKRLAEVKRKQEAEKKRLAQIEKERAAKAAEAKRREEAESKRLAAAEKKRRDEEARLAALEAQKKADEAKKKAAAEAERKRRAEETAQRQREIAEEAARQAAAANRVAQSTANRYIGIIKDRVQRSWLRPAALPKGLKALVFVRLDPFGEVLEVRVVRSSGNPLFDRSAETAVKKASPLPMPSDVTIYNRFFRELQFEFDPDQTG
jgi:colicin import membrane protein